MSASELFLAIGLAIVSFPVFLARDGIVWTWHKVERPFHKHKKSTTSTTQPKPPTAN